MTKTLIFASELLLLIACSACSSNRYGLVPSMPSPNPSAATPIRHIVVIMQENRSFDHMFNGFPGADTVQYGMNHSVVVPLTPMPLGNSGGGNHSHNFLGEKWGGRAEVKGLNGT